MMDFSMPICSGIEATIKIRRYFTENADPDMPQPFICCITSYSRENQKMAALKSGMDGFMSKPIFKAGIERVLKKAGITQ